MAHSLETRQQVRSEYVRGLPLKAACAMHDVAYQTARGWKRKAKAAGDDWDTARAAVRLSSGSVSELTSAIIEDFVHLFQGTIDAVKVDKDLSPLAKADTIAKLSDAYQKTVKAAGASNPQLNRLSVIMDVLQKTMQFIRREYPQYTDIFMEVLEPLGEELSRELA